MPVVEQPCVYRLRKEYHSTDPNGPPTPSVYHFLRAPLNANLTTANPPFSNSASSHILPPLLHIQCVLQLQQHSCTGDTGPWRNADGPCNQGNFKQHQGTQLAIHMAINPMRKSTLHHLIVKGQRLLLCVASYMAVATPHSTAHAATAVSTTQQHIHAATALGTAVHCCCCWV